MTCASCGAELVSGDEVCWRCGSAVGDPGAPRVCPSCAGPVAPTATECRRCGHRMPAPMATPPPAVPPPDPTWASSPPTGADPDATQAVPAAPAFPPPPAPDPEPPVERAVVTAAEPPDDGGSAVGKILIALLFGVIMGIAAAVFFLNVDDDGPSGSGDPLVTTAPQRDEGSDTTAGPEATTTTEPADPALVAYQESVDDVIGRYEALRTALGAFGPGDQTIDFRRDAERFEAVFDEAAADRQALADELRTVTPPSEVAGLHAEIADAIASAADLVAATSRAGFECLQRDDCTKVSDLESYGQFGSEGAAGYRELQAILGRWRDALGV